MWWRQDALINLKYGTEQHTLRSHLLVIFYQKGAKGARGCVYEMLQIIKIVQIRRTDQDDILA